MDGYELGNPGDDPAQRLDGQHSRRRPPRGNDHAGGRWLPPRAGRGHDDRRSLERHDGGRSGAACAPGEAKRAGRESGACAAGAKRDLKANQPMPQFSYKAVKRDGVLTEGSLDAGNRHEAMRQVEHLGLKPIRLSEAANGAGRKESPAPASPGPTAAAAGAAGSAGVDGAGGGHPLASLRISLGVKQKISARVLENFNRLLSSLLAAGVPLSRALVRLYR